MKKVILSHGDKGGIGKSHLADLVLTLGLLNEIDIGLLDADAGTGGNPNVYQRYEGLVESQKMTIREGEPIDTATRFFETVCKMKADNIIVNLPAGASFFFSKLDSLLSEAVTLAGVDLRIAYIISNTQSSINSAIDVIKNDPIFEVSKLTLINNEFSNYGNIQNNFEALEPNKVLTLKALDKEIIEAIGERKGFFQAINGDADNLFLMERLKLYNWADVHKDILDTLLL